MRRYFIELKAREYVKDMDFYHLEEIYLANTEKKLLNTATKTGLNALKTATKKIVHKAAEPTGEFIESKIANKL